MTDTILAVNTGSSNIKFAAFAVDAGGALANSLYHGLVDQCFGQAHLTVTDDSGKRVTDKPITTAGQNQLSHEQMVAAAVSWVVANSRSLDLLAVGHRVVHGGRGVAPAARVDDGLLESLEKLLPLDPPCLAQSLAAIRALQAAAPGLLHVACFDGAFYRTGASVSRALPLPREIEEAGLEDYGYHGLSYEYIAQVLPTFLGSAAEGRVVVAHLGNESSMCAMRQREHVANTADIRALESLPMGTRCGALDPGVILYLMSERGMSRQEITRLLYHQSGLLGVSGISGDMRELLQNTSPTAAQAIELFVYRIGRELGSLAAAIDGLDALVFTGGIGEHAASVRAAVCRNASWLGLTLDEAANLSNGPRISRRESHVSAWVIPTDEELMIARHTHEVFRGEGKA